MRLRHAVTAVAFALAVPHMALAQETNVAFGGLKTDVSQPVEVNADQLSVDQNNGLATFSGNVIVVQGQMRLQAAEIRVEYTTETRAIKALHASGGVTVTTGTDAATSETADYMPDTGDLVLMGQVVMTQGQVAISGETLTLSLKTGLGSMSGRVTTTFAPGQKG